MQFSQFVGAEHCLPRNHHHHHRRWGLYKPRFVFSCCFPLVGSRKRHKGQGKRRKPPDNKVSLLFCIEMNFSFARWRWREPPKKATPTRVCLTVCFVCWHQLNVKSFSSSGLLTRRSGDRRGEGIDLLSNSRDSFVRYIILCIQLWSSLQREIFKSFLLLHYVHSRKCCLHYLTFFCWKKKKKKTMTNSWTKQIFFFFFLANHLDNLWTHQSV